MLQMSYSTTATGSDFPMKSLTTYSEYLSTSEYKYNDDDVEYSRGGGGRRHRSSSFNSTFTAAQETDDSSFPEAVSSEWHLHLAITWRVMLIFGVGVLLACVYGVIILIDQARDIDRYSKSFTSAVYAYFGSKAVRITERLLFESTLTT